MCQKGGIMNANLSLIWSFQYFDNYLYLRMYKFLKIYHLRNMEDRGKTVLPNQEKKFKKLIA